MSFAQGAPTQPLVLQGSNVFLYGSSTTGNAFTVQQLSVGNVASFVTSTGATGLIVNPTGLVGIGKTNPGYALDVTGDLNFTGTFRQNGTPYVGSQWTGTSTLYFVGNVGINTTSVANPLTVNGTVVATTFSGSGASLTSLPMGQASGTLAIANGGTGLTTTSQNFVFAGPTSGGGAPSFRALVSGDVPTLNQNTTGSAGSLSTTYGSGQILYGQGSGVPASTSTFIYSSGSVGIGTAVIQGSPAGGGNSPVNMFVYGTSSSAHGALIQCTGGSAGTANLCLNTDGTNANIELRNSGNTGVPYIDFASSSPSVDYDARMILVNNGNTFSISSNILQLNPTTGVGIGTASIGGGQAKLWSANDVTLTTGNYAGDVAAQIMAVGTTNPLKRLALMYDTTNNIGLVQAMVAGTGTSPLILNAAGGNVGIGITNPTSYTLQVSGSVGASSSFTRTTGSTAVAFNAPGTGLASTDYNYILAGANDTANRLVVFVNGSTRTADGGASNVTIRNDLGSLILGNGSYPTIVYGNVGIGTASPGTTLDVNGSMNAQNFAQPTFTNQQYTTITTATSMAAATYGSAGGITISKTASGTTTWDACAYSNQSYKYGAYCSARAAQTSAYVMWGLSANQTAANLSTSAYAYINYAWYFEATGTLYIYENGTQVATYGTYNVTTSCSITFDGSNIIYWKDGVAVRTVARAVGSPLFFMCTPYNSGGSTIYDVQFGEKGNPYNPGQVITASTGMFSNTVIACKTGASASGAETPGAHAIMAFAPDGATVNASIWMGFDPTNDCGYINSARSGQIRPIAIQTRGGNVGIGITNPTSYTLQVAGTIGASGNITAFTSDKRLKKKTGPITDALDKVCKLEGFTYVHNEIANKYGFNEVRQYVGLSAQDLQEVLPEVVFPAPFDAENQSGQNYLTVQYERVVPLLVEALKEERAKRESLEERIAKLEKLVL